MSASRSRKVAAAAVAAAAGSALAFSGMPAAGAATAPVPRMYSGVVRSVQDGDTFQIDLAGDGTTAPVQFRSAEINAPEAVNGYVLATTGKRVPECQAYASRAFVLNRIMRRTSRVVSGKLVTSYVPKTAKVYSTNPAERSLGRRVGQPWYWNGTTWRNLDRELVQAGLAMWMPDAFVAGESDAGSRNAWWDTWYAWGKQVGLYHPDGCGADQPAVTLQGWLDWDNGTRSKAAGETIDFRNTSTTTLLMSGWSLRSGQPESYRPTYHFPNGLALHPGDVVRLHFGTGTLTATEKTTTGTEAARADASLGAFAPATTYTQWDLYMAGRQGVGISDPVNSRTSSWSMYFLQDKYLNVRSIAATPCYAASSCTDQRKGAFALSRISSVGGVNEEYVDLVATRSVDTTGLYAVIKPYSVAWAQPLPDNLRMQAGDVLRFHTGAGVARTDANGVTHMYLNIAGVPGMTAFASAVRGFLDEVHPTGWIGIRSSTDEKVGGWSLGSSVPSWLR